MNNFLNFRLPDFQNKYGSDWNDFIDLMEEIYDEIYVDTVDLYSLSNIDKMRDEIVIILLSLFKIETTLLDTKGTRKNKLREFVNVYRKKGLAEIYLDVGESVTGLIGNLYTAKEKGGWVIGEDIIPLRLESEQDLFIILYDAKTVDAGEIDIIVSMLRDKYLYPAFYKMYIVDSSLNVLAEV